jgi:molybdate transport system regulatory protein
MPQQPVISIRIEFGDHLRIGPGKIRLLELIAQTGSISAAARQMDMSYRRAWLLIDELKSILNSPAVETNAGGAGGGGAKLTGVALALIAHYRALETATQSQGESLLKLIGNAE